MELSRMETALKGVILFCLPLLAAGIAAVFAREGVKLLYRRWFERKKRECRRWIASLGPIETKTFPKKAKSAEKLGQIGHAKAVPFLVGANLGAFMIVFFVLYFAVYNSLQFFSW